MTLSIEERLRRQELKTQYLMDIRAVDLLHTTDMISWEEYFSRVNAMVDKLKKDLG